MNDRKELQAMIAKYKNLDTQASPKPWKLWGGWYGSAECIGHTEYAGLRQGGENDYGTDSHIVGSQADIEIVALSRNLCPDLIAALNESGAQIDQALQAKITEYNESLNSQDFPVPASPIPWELWGCSRLEPDNCVKRIGPRIRDVGLTAQNVTNEIIGSQADLAIVVLCRNLCPDLIAALEEAWARLDAQAGGQP